MPNELHSKDWDEYKKSLCKFRAFVSELAWVSKAIEGSVLGTRERIAGGDTQCCQGLVVAMWYLYVSVYMKQLLKRNWEKLPELLMELFKQAILNVLKN